MANDPPRRSPLGTSKTAVIQHAKNKTKGLNCIMEKEKTYDIGIVKRNNARLRMHARRRDYPDIGDKRIRNNMAFALPGRWHLLIMFRLPLEPMRQGFPGEMRIRYQTRSENSSETTAGAAQHHIKPLSGHFSMTVPCIIIRCRLHLAHVLDKRPPICICACPQVFHPIHAPIGVPRAPP